MIITIDGPAGAGKSSAAKALAKRLGFEFLDTGAMFRAVTLLGLRAGIDLRDQNALGRLMAGLKLEMPPGGRVLVNGEDVTHLLRTPEITAGSSPIAESRVVRQHLAALQRKLAEERNMVCEGRDQGTVVFPDAVCKFFLVADPTERALRRQREMAGRGQVFSLEEVLSAQQERDRRDSQRDVAPMVPAQDAVVLDSTQMSLDAIVDRMETLVQRRRKIDE